MRRTQWMLATAIVGITCMATSVAKAQDGLISVDVTGDLATRGNGRAVFSFDGTLDITDFTVNADGELVAEGTLTADVLNPALRRVRSIVRDVELVVTDIITEVAEDGTVIVTGLEIGGIDLRVLGFTLAVDPISLEFTGDTSVLLGMILSDAAEALEITVDELLDTTEDLAALLEEAGLLEVFLEALLEVEVAAGV